MAAKKKARAPAKFIYLAYTDIDDYCHFNSAEAAEAEAQAADDEMHYLIAKVCVSSTIETAKPKRKRTVYAA